MRRRSTRVYQNVETEELEGVGVLGDAVLYAEERLEDHQRYPPPQALPVDPKCSQPPLKLLKRNLKRTQRPPHSLVEQTLEPPAAYPSDLKFRCWSSLTLWRLIELRKER